MLIGFGSTEKETALRIIKECGQAFKAEGFQGVKDIQKKYDEESKCYKKLSREEAPERYSYFWAVQTLIYEGKYFIEFSMHHINRRHAFSPDGWALLKTEWILRIHPDENDVIFCVA